MILPGAFVGMLVLLAAAGPQFDVTDARGKKPAGVVIEAGAPDADGWMELKVGGKSKVPYVLIWPYDGRAKGLEGPGAVPVMVVERGDAKALASSKVVTALLAARLLGRKVEAGFEVGPVGDNAEDYWATGVGLLAAGKAAEAVEPLGKAVRERERVLTRIPSELYPAAMLYGRALLAAGKFDDAALAFLKAVKLRPGEMVAREARAEALVKAGKAEAAREALAGK